MLRGKMELLRLALIALVAQGVSGVFFDKKPVEPENGKRLLRRASNFPTKSENDRQLNRRVQTSLEAQVESQVETPLEMFDHPFFDWRSEEEGMGLGMSLPTEAPSSKYSKISVLLLHLISIRQYTLTDVASTAFPSSAPSVTATPTQVASNFPTLTPTMSASPTTSPTTSSFPTQTHSPTSTPTTTPSLSPTTTCNLSLGARSALIRLKLASVSELLTVFTAGTPQNEAADWLINLDELRLCPEADDLIQRYVLAVFYYSTRGNQWLECSAPDFEDPIAIDTDTANADCTIVVDDGESDAWLTPSSECNWGGVICDIEGHVIGLEMSTFCFPLANLLVYMLTHSIFSSIDQNGVNGQLPSEMIGLMSLQKLLLGGQALSGPIPTKLGEIPTLEILDLNFNLLTGSMPNTLYSLTSLEHFNLNGNQLTGTISTLIGTMSSLKTFTIDNNEMTGQIPSEMGDLQLLGTQQLHLTKIDS